MTRHDSEKLIAIGLIPGPSHTQAEKCRVTQDGQIHTTGGNTTVRVF
jgi:hypothetical protein